MNTVASLPAKWRKEVERGTGHLNDEADRAMLSLADELEDALASPAPSAGVVDRYSMEIVPGPHKPYVHGRLDPEGNWCLFNEVAALIRRLATPEQPGSAVQGEASEHVRKQVGRLAQWLHCMSHNESYFGEPAGLVKSVTEELAHAVDPIYPPIVPPADPLAGVTIHTATVTFTTPPPAPAARNKYCSDERPCTPCFSDSGVCEDAPAADPAEQFCDGHCTWSDHHPDCVRASPAAEPPKYEDLIRYVTQPDARGVERFVATIRSLARDWKVREPGDDDARHMRSLGFAAMLDSALENFDRATPNPVRAEQPENFSGCTVADKQEIGVRVTSAEQPEGKGAYPAGSDREVLMYLMQQFDAESWECPCCGHSQDCATMDSADYLRRYLAFGQHRAAHPDDVAVDAFAAAMKDKLTAARVKGRGGWNTEEATAESLSIALRRHVEKGDPRDVANFAMFLYLRGESILPVRPLAPAAPVGVDEAMVERVSEAIWPVAKSSMESSRWDRAGGARQAFIRQVVRAALTAALAGKEGAK